MTRSNKFDHIFEQFDQFFVGFEPLFNSITASGYPPHNILQRSSSEHVLELACAGFKKNEIEISVSESLLTITGNKESKDTDDLYQYRGLASRSFSKSFRIAEFHEVVSAKLEDGILSVTFKKNAPETSETKFIPIK